MGKELQISESQAYISRVLLWLYNNEYSRNDYCCNNNIREHVTRWMYSIPLLYVWCINTLRDSTGIFSGMEWQKACERSDTQMEAREWRQWQGLPRKLWWSCSKTEMLKNITPLLKLRPATHTITDFRGFQSCLELYRRILEMKSWTMASLQTVGCMCWRIDGRRILNQLLQREAQRTGGGRGQGVEL